MENTESIALKYKPVWLVIGFLLIAFVVQQTLTASPVSPGISVSDKVLHFAGYFILMGWFMLIFHQARAKLVCAVLFILMGVGLEYLQGMGGIRHYEVNDMLANGLGVLGAWAVSFTRLSNSLMVFERLLLSNK